MKRIAAVIYPDEDYPMAAFAKLVEYCRGRGMSLAGVLQYPAFKGGDHRCDVVLEDLAFGHRTPLFENRGAGARGCRLDAAALAEVSARIEGVLDQAPDLIFLNKFGKVECDGGGLRDVIATAVDRNIAVTIGVPKRNLALWREFAGPLAVEIQSDDDDALERWAGNLLIAVEA
ncbi:MAG: DUF2478 domain-containing protein [Afipia sp.]|nr:DUF2478 domain-containing protein [Afipia sp.]